jgi:hypothetical protein
VVRKEGLEPPHQHPLHVDKMKSCWLGWGIRKKKLMNEIMSKLWECKRYNESQFTERYRIIIVASVVASYRSIAYLWVSKKIIFICTLYNQNLLDFFRSSHAGVLTNFGQIFLLLNSSAKISIPGLMIWTTVESTIIRYLPENQNSLEISCISV